MNWDLMKKSELLFEKYEIKPVLGVIPNNKDKELLSYPKQNDFWEQLRKWRDKGWEISPIPTKEQVGFYNDNGYLKFGRIFSKSV